MDQTKIIEQIEDLVTPQLSLDVTEARLYYHLLRRSRLLDKEEVTFSVGQMSETLNCSKSAVKPRLRTLEDKSVIQVLGTGWAGTRVRVRLPLEIPGVIAAAESEASVELESLDFFTDARHRAAIFEREGGSCFYCLRLLASDERGLDHVRSQLERGSNSYRNVVAACHSCNSSKGASAAEDHLRNLYRRRVLTVEQFEERLGHLERLIRGELRPTI